MRNVGFILFVLAVSLATAPLRAAPSAESIVAHYIGAIGGADQVALVKSLVIRGVYVEGSYRNEHAALAKMRPYYKLVGDPDHPSSEFAEGYDGSAWEYYGKPGIVLRTVGAASEATRHSVSLLSPLADYRDEGSEISLAGSDMIAGRKAWRIRLRMRDGFEQDEFVDAANWRLIAERKVAPVHAIGEEVTSETRFSDFRKVDGILLPFLSREVAIATGQELNRFEVREALVNRPIPVSAFSPPSFARGEVQSLIETLFAQRDDPGTVLWTLFDFRRAHPDVGTDEACRIAGYQMVKMKDFAAATALLERNAALYPQSAGAASSLGRALAASGDKERARPELTRALSLDPSDKRAKDALDALGS